MQTSSTAVRASLLAVCATIGVTSGQAWSADVSEIELRRLFQPTDAELAAEERGRLYIYEGLRDTDVQRALDEEFERVDNMMFIRTRKTDQAGEVKRDEETGEEEYEDDGC
jgi:hypothetical protein